MFAVIRHYHLIQRTVQRSTAGVHEDFVPIVKKAKGFVRYYWLDFGKGEGASVSVFNDKAGADEFVNLAANYVREASSKSSHSETRDDPRANQSSRLSADNLYLTSDANPSTSRHCFRRSVALAVDSCVIDRHPPHINNEFGGGLGPQTASENSHQRPDGRGPGYLTSTRYPERNRAIFLLSVRAGLRAKEIASLTWAMLTDAEGKIGDAIHLVDEASKGSSGRVIPLNKELKAALVQIHKSQVGAGRRPSWSRRKSQADERGGDREPVRRLVSGPGLQRLLEPQRTPRVHHQRREEDRDRRRLAEGRAALGWTCIALDHSALHRSACRRATADRRVGLTLPRDSTRWSV